MLDGQRDRSRTPRLDNKAPGMSSRHNPSQFDLTTTVDGQAHGHAQPTSRHHDGATRSPTICIAQRTFLPSQGLVAPLRRLPLLLVVSGHDSTTVLPWEARRTRQGIGAVEAVGEGSAGGTGGCWLFAYAEPSAGRAAREVAIDCGARHIAGRGDPPCGLLTGAVGAAEPAPPGRAEFRFASSVVCSVLGPSVSLRVGQHARASSPPLASRAGR